MFTTFFCSTKKTSYWKKRSNGEEGLSAVFDITTVGQ